MIVTTDSSTPTVTAGTSVRNVPLIAGIYEIIAFGAVAGFGTNTNGSYGAEISGVCQHSSAQTLNIVVGAGGESGNL